MEDILFSLGIISAPLKEGTRLAEALVSEKLAACVQISSPVTSIYRWEGNIEHTQEVLLFVKTDSEHIPLIREFLEKEHPYDVPEFITISITDGLPGYLKWIWDSLRQE